jgi:ferritin-like metal-binding protein YciE
METTQATMPTLENSRLQKFFIDEIKDIYWAENHLLKAIPKMEEAAYSADLKQAFAEHLEVTKGHVTRLEQVFDKLGESAEGKKCDAIAGITDEGEEIIDDTEDRTATRDAALILAAQKVEHYEISTYGGLIKLANSLGHTEIAQLLNATLAEEKLADQSLSTLAEGGINTRASYEQVSEN